MEIKLTLFIIITLATWMVCAAAEIHFEDNCDTGDYKKQKWEDSPTNEPFVTFTVSGVSGTDPSITVTYNTGDSMDYEQKQDNNGLNKYHIHKKKPLFDPPKDYSVVSVTVKDVGGTKKKDCMVILKKVNRYEPRFEMLPKNSFSIPENSDSIRTITTLIARDEDISRGFQTLTFKFSNTENDFENKFSLVSVLKGTFYEVEVKTTDKTLDYEDINLYNLVVTVTDSSEERPDATEPKTADITLIVNVEDVHDQDPRITNQCGFKSFPEHGPLETEIARVTAVDGDTKLKNTMQYSIVDTDERANEYFKVDPTTGNITIQKELDREHDHFINNPNLKFSILIQEMNELSGNLEGPPNRATSECTFSITDIDDQFPKFNAETYTSEIDEHSRANLQFDVDHFINDMDLGENAEYRVEILDLKEMFSVSPATGINKVSFFVQVIGDLDYDGDSLGPEKNVKFTVQAKGKLNEMKTSKASFTVTVKDINDNSPVFTSSESVEVYEHAPAGTLVIKLTAKDIDTGDFGTQGIVYKLLSAAYEKDFDIDSKSGEMTVKADHSLDRERSTEAYVTVSATDNKGVNGRTTTQQLTIKILDINDKPPVFRLTTLSSVLAENSTVLQGSYEVEATDADLEAPNNTIEFRLSHYAKYFRIHKDESSGMTTGTLTLLKELDFEDQNDEELPTFTGEERVAKRQFNFQVQAYDLGVPDSLTSNPNATIKIDFTDVNDNWPEFDPATCGVQITINETDLPSKHAPGFHQVRATDADISKDYNTVVYFLNDQSSQDFVVDRQTGHVNIARGSDLSPELKPNGKEHVVLIEASDGTNTQQEKCKVNITVNDINNKMPRFTKQPENKDYLVVEEQKYAESVFQYEAEDVDESHLLKFSIDYANSRPEYNRYDMAASQEYVKDNLKTIYVINPETGELTVTKVDRERLLSIELIVQVEDLNAEEPRPQIVTADRTIRIVSLDINDNDPIFQNTNKGEYFATIPENENRTRLLKVEAIDEDVDNVITYTLEHPDKRTEPYLKIHSDTGVIDMLEVDYDHNVTGFHFMVFDVVATDNGKPDRRRSQVQVNVTIIDVNDNDPIFVNVNYSVTVPENETLGSWLFKMNATDEDSGQFGTVNYMVYDGQQHGEFFSIDVTEGDVTLRYELDFETVQYMQPIFIAFDNPQGYERDRRKTQQTLSVYVTDVNDNAPEFTNKQSKCFELLETRSVDWPVGKVEAEDKDEKGTENSRIEFSIIAGNNENYFGINPDTGDIKLLKSVQNLTKEGLENPLGKIHNLNIMAEDCGDPRLNSTEIYCIEIIEANLNAPYFTKPTEAEHVSFYDTYAGNVYKVEAFDLDGGEHGKVTFSLTDTFSGLFAIDVNTGQIRTTRPLMKKEGDKYALEVEAKDQTEPHHKSEKNAVINVFVKSETDERPHFHEDDREGNVMLNFTEHDKTGETQTIPEANYDANIQGDKPKDTIMYTLKDGSDLFVLNNRELRVRGDKELDREVKAFHNIVVQTHSGPLPPITEDPLKRDVINITIRVVDINDKAPEFTQQVFTGGIASSLRVDSPQLVTTVTATDEDEGENARITYSITSEIFKEDQENLDHVGANPFELNATDGRILVTFQPSLNSKGFFRFHVNATDGGGLTDQAEVRIYLMSDDQRIKITITKQVSEVTSEVKAKFSKAMFTATGHYCNIDHTEAYSGSAPKQYTDLKVHFVDPKTNQPLEAKADKTVAFSESTSEPYTDLTVHFVDPKTNKPLDATTAVELIIKSKRNITAALKSMENMVLMDARKLSDDKTVDSFLTEENIKYMLMGCSAFLLLALAVAVAIFLFKMSSLKRNLKAATANAFGSHDSGLNKIGVAASAPNTNRHMNEGSNPVFSQDEIKFPVQEFDSDVGSLDSFESTSSFGEEPSEMRTNPGFIEDLEDKYMSYEIPQGVEIEEMPIEEPETPVKDPKSTITALKQINSDWRRRATKTDLGVDEPRKSLASPAILNLFDNRRPSTFPSAPQDFEA